jgi:hypothetical protein
MREIIENVKSMAEDGDTEKICSSLDELESVEEEQEICMLQLHEDKMTLLAKIHELDQVMKGVK